MPHTLKDLRISSFLESRSLLACSTQSITCCFDAVLIFWPACCWETFSCIHSAHWSRQKVLKGLFKHTSNGWTLDVQPPGITPTDTFALRRSSDTSSVICPVKVSHIRRVCCFFVYRHRTLWIQTLVNSASFHAFFLNCDHCTCWNSQFFESSFSFKNHHRWQHVSCCCTG